MISHYVSQSSEFPVLLGEQSNLVANVRFLHFDYNEVIKCAAAGGDVRRVSIFPSHTTISSGSANLAPLVSVYDDSQDMSLLWSKALQISSQSIRQVRLSPDGTKLVVGINSIP